MFQMQLRSGCSVDSQISIKATSELVVNACFETLNVTKIILSTLLPGVLEFIGPNSNLILGDPRGLLENFVTRELIGVWNENQSPG